MKCRTVSNLRLTVMTGVICLREPKWDISWKNTFETSKVQILQFHNLKVSLQESNDPIINPQMYRVQGFDWCMTPDLSCRITFCSKTL